MLQLKTLLLSLLCFTSVSFAFASESSLRSPVFVRIRLFKDLQNFPQPMGAVSKRLSKNIWSLGGEDLTYLEKKLSPVNFVIKKTDGSFDLVAVFDFNQYLAGVVSGEVPNSWPLEALKAQAVVARSFALARVSERQQKYYHLDADQSDQVFKTGGTDKAKRAVYETDGVVLTTQGGEILKAFYHSDCGGQTVKASEVWGNKTYDSGTAIDPWCAERRSNSWQMQISKEQFWSKLAEIARRVLPPIEGLNLNFAGKTQKIDISDASFSVQKLRQVFGYSQIRSSIDQIEISGENIKISGQGYGHGAGLCQWGTLAQVKLGRSYEEVLRHYYPLAKLTRQQLRLGQIANVTNDLKRVSN